MIKLIISVLLASIAIFFGSKIQDSMIDMGVSWTLAKVTTYALAILSGIFMASFIAGLLKGKNVFLRKFIPLFGFVLPFVITFIFHPIFEGDFANNATKLNMKMEEGNPNTNLMIITIPGCPFCMGAIPTIKKIKARNPKAVIEFVVCSSDSTTLNEYKKEVNGAFMVRLAKDMDKLAAMAGGTFPSFILLKNGYAKSSWSNNTFGVVALDALESELPKSNF